jgi:hypothetical protein
LSVQTSTSQSPPAIPAWIAIRLAHPDLNHGTLANYFQHPAHEATPKAKAILVQADQAADEVGLRGMTR